MCLCAQVIEVFIRSEEGLSRDMVKHLNSIEEQVLESRAWTKDSALWSALQAAGNKVPTVEEVRGTHIIHNNYNIDVKHVKICLEKSSINTKSHLFLQVNFSSSLDTGSASGSCSVSGGQSHLPMVALSPIIHPRIREFRSGLGSARKGGSLSRAGLQVVFLT